MNLISPIAVGQNEEEISYVSTENDWMQENLSTSRVSRNQRLQLPVCPNAGLLIAFGRGHYIYLNVSKAP